MKIVAELANGYIVDERSKIPEIVSEKITKINRILINPTNCRPAPGVIEAIKKCRLYCNWTRKFIYKCYTKLVGKWSNKGN